MAVRVVVYIHVPMYREAILARIGGTPGIELTVVDNLDDLEAALPGAEAIISAGASIYTARMAEIVRRCGTSLRWFQTVAAGNDGMTDHGVPGHITVTGSGGHNAPIVAEAALALLLSIAHIMPDFVAAKAEHRWGRKPDHRYTSLYGKTACVVGFGNIGQEIARRLKAFDLKVLSVTRSGAAHGLADQAYPVTDLKTAISLADAVILSVPLSPQTHHLIGAAELAAFKPSAYLVNIARGGLVDQAALIAALRENRIAGAALDVADPEPLPADHPLWDAPHLIISPHCGGAGSTESPKRLAATVQENLESFLAGRPLKNVLDFG